MIVKATVQWPEQNRLTGGKGFLWSSPLCTLMPLGSYLSMRPCTWSGRAGGNSKELRRESLCFWLMNLVKCSLVM